MRIAAYQAPLLPSSSMGALARIRRRVAWCDAEGRRHSVLPTNNRLSAGKAGTDLRAEARRADVALAVENRMWVIRADVAGRCGGLESYGSSAIVSPDGIVVRRARALAEDLIVAEIDVH